MKIDDDLHDRLQSIGLAASRGNQSRTLRELIEQYIEAFGPARCMFESNFPVDKISGSYGNYWNAFKRLASGASANEKAQLFKETARRFYRL